MLSMMPDLLGKANQRQTTRRGWRCGGARPGWQQNQAHDLGQTISRVCCTPRLSSSRSERTTGRSWCCNVTRALDASWNALSLGFGGAQFLHRASDNVLPMIARQWLFMHFWWHWDSNCPPSRRSSSFQRCSKPRWIHDVPVKDVPHNAIWPARTAAGGLDHREDALARRDRGHEHSVLHIQQLQAASDGAARVPRWSIRLRNYGATIVCVM